MFPSITLYILNYNYSEYLVQAIDSALRQDHGDFELIIIDDGSADDSRDKVRPYEGRENITVVEKGIAVGKHLHPSGVLSL